MSNETNNKPAEAAKTKKADRVAYEVVGTLNMGRVNGELQVRNAGETVYEDELGAEMTQYLLARGEIADRNKPVPPSQASMVAAHEHLVDVARQLGVVTIRGGEYRMKGEETVYAGSIAFRAAVSIDRLKTAIVAAAKG